VRELTETERQAPNSQKQLLQRLTSVA
jgi:hypothetical protein